jgi:hypothetical protein
LTENQYQRITYYLPRQRGNVSLTSNQVKALAFFTIPPTLHNTLTKMAGVAGLEPE